MSHGLAHNHLLFLTVLQRRDKPSQFTQGNIWTIMNNYKQTCVLDIPIVSWIPKVPNTHPMWSQPTSLAASPKIPLAFSFDTLPSFCTYLSLYLKCSSFFSIKGVFPHSSWTWLNVPSFPTVSQVAGSPSSWLPQYYYYYYYYSSDSIVVGSLTRKWTLQG